MLRLYCADISGYGISHTVNEAFIGEFRLINLIGLYIFPSPLPDPVSLANIRPIPILNIGSVHPWIKLGTKINTRGQIFLWEELHQMQQSVFSHDVRENREKLKLSLNYSAV